MSFLAEGSAMRVQLSSRMETCMMKVWLIFWHGQRNRIAITGISLSKLGVAGSANISISVTEGVCMTVI